ncbi:hypothetical protein NKG94_31305 [Micromonospora sp. M12]
MPATVAHLEWAVVLEQDVAGLRLPAMVERRWTLLVAGAVVGIALLTTCGSCTSSFGRCGG